MKLSASMKCWNTIPMPTPMASAGDWSWTSAPLTAIVPHPGAARRRGSSSGSTCAPFSPTIACTVPRRTAKAMSLLAMTPGKRLVIPCSSTARSLAAGAAGVLMMHAPWVEFGRGVRQRRQGPDERYRVIRTLSDQPKRRFTQVAYRRREGRYIASGTLISPEMILALYSSSLALMSSILPPVVA